MFFMFKYLPQTQRIKLALFIMKHYKANLYHLKVYNHHCAPLAVEIHLTPEEGVMFLVLRIILKIQSHTNCFKQRQLSAQNTTL